MTDDVWTALNAVQESFNEIHTLEFLVEKLQDAVMSGDTGSVENATTAIASFLPLFTKDWEDSFYEAWKVCGGNLSVCDWIESCD